MSTTNPYFTADDRDRFTYEVYLRTIRPSVYATGDYRVKTLGGSIKFGVPFSELDRVFFGIGLENTQVSTDSTSPRCIASTCVTSAVPAVPVAT